MSLGLVRFHQTGDLHFITFSCVRHRNILGSAEARDTFQRILEETRAKHTFHILGYVIMPNHVHLLVTEPETIQLSKVVQVLKQRFSRTRTEEYVWEPRYYDFNVYSERKRIEKLRYIHRNPVARHLVAEPAHYPWSSFRAYASTGPHPVTISTQPW
jgi:putative transposase